MSKISINNFSDGMVPDIDNSVRSRNSYDLAENLRYIANKYANTGALHSVESSSSITNVFNVTGERIIGHVKIRNYLIVFTTRWVNSSVRVDQIRRFVINDNGTLSSGSVLWGGNNLYRDSAGSDADDMPEMLSVVGRYEDSDNIKVYWANSTRPIRVGNVAQYLTTDGAPPGTYLDQERFNLVTTFDIGSPEFDSIVSGSLETGRVDYAYSLLKENGQESVLSGTLDGSKINLFFDSISNSSTVQIDGDSEIVNTGKGVKLNVNISPDDYSFFDKIRLYRIHYKEYGQLPQIVIVNDSTINASGDNEIIDSGGSGLGEYTVEEFSIVSGVSYSAYTIEEKDNILFAGNVSEEIFDVDFDARAYRFNTDGTARLYEDYSNYESPEYTITSATWDTVDDKANCICPTNDIETDVAGSAVSLYTVTGTLFTASGAPGWTTNEFIGFRICNRNTATSSVVISNTSNTITTNSSIVWTIGDLAVVTSEYIYKADTPLTEGGEGPNVEYTFSVPVPGQVDLESSTTLSVSETYSGDADYSDPNIVNIYTTFQRSEIYRFGLVFYDINGNKSTVKWIGDIRIPGPESPTSSFRQYLVNLGNAYPISLLITLKSGLPTGAVAFEVVRAIKTENDKSIIAAGYAAPTMDVDLVTYGGQDFTCKPRAPYGQSTPSEPYNIGGPGVATSTTNRRIVSFVSPTNLFYENVDVKEGDYLDSVGELTLYVNDTESEDPYPDTDTNKYNVIKYRRVSFFSNVIGITRRTIEELQYVSGTNQIEKYGFSQAATQGFTNCALLNLTIGVKTAAPTGRTLFLQIDDDLSETGLSNYDLPYTYIKRNNTERYGGYSYQNRLKTNYISASYVVNTSTIESKKGDTYINYFNYLDYMFDVDYSAALLGGSSQFMCAGFVNFPCESKINSNLRYDDHFAKVYNNPTSYLMREKAGVYTDGTDEYEQDKDLYLYNSIYSQEQNIDYDFPESNINLRTEFDSRVVYSDKKFDDEYIDSWSKFKVNNFLDLESKHGPIKSLKKHDNILYFAQDSSFGALSVNQRSLISDANPGQLSLGSGGTLERFDYINEYYGCQHKKSINANKGGIYFIDSDKTSMINYNGKFEVLSDSKGFRTIMKEATIIDIPFVEGNNKHNEVYWKFDGNNILVFNNFTNTFIGNYTFSPDYIGDAGGITFHRNVDTNGYAYSLYSNGSHFGSFDNGVTFNDSILKVTNNEDFSKIKVYNNLIFFTNSRAYSVALSTDIERNTDKFDSVRYWNDYQYTGVKNLTLGTTLAHRERDYATDIPRNIVNVNGTTNIDIFDPTNHNASREFKERMRDKYITAELTYENTASKGQLSVPYIGFKYRNSKR